MGNLVAYNSNTDKWNNWRFDDYKGGYIYPNIGIPENFTVAEYEILQIIKK